MKRPRSDNRPDWRDPNMKVLVYASDDGGLTFHPKYVEPHLVRDYYEKKMDNPFASGEPDYKNDPTYDLKSKKKVGK